ncbi:hypothetical protein QL285_066056 [Trifolium repens]|nr:hypothetical protein QL285_066056 [Trifolium repens]
MVFNEKCSAGSKFNDIADKLPGREDVCIDVRILHEFEVENGADVVIRGVNDADECFCYDAFVYFVVEIQAPLHPF